MNEEEFTIVNPVISPLTIVKGKDGKKHIQDQDTKEEYAIVEGDRLRMYNTPSDDDNGIQGIFYKVADVAEIRLSSKVNCVEVRTQDGNTFTHMKDQNGYRIVDLAPPNYADSGVSSIINVFRHLYPNHRDYLYWDVMRDRPMLDTAMFGDSPSKIVSYVGGTKSPELTRIRAKMSEQTYEALTPKGNVKTMNFKPDRADVDAAVRLIASENPRDTFLDHLRRIHWDGIHRVSDFLYMNGCTGGIKDPNNNAEYLRIVSEGIFLTVLQRHLDEDMKEIQFIPILIGPQGVGKSTMCKRLGMSRWFRSTTKSFDDDKAFYESVQGATVVELKESTQLEKGMLSTIKAFADASSLQYRKSYGEDSTEGIRIYFTMIATTNNETILRDDANRRFFPVHMYREDAYKEIEDWTDEEIEQLWAEALQLYKSGKRWDSRIYVDKKGGLKSFILEAQGSAVQMEGWEIRLKQLIDEYYPHKGDRVKSTMIRQYLERGDPAETDEDVRVDKYGREIRKAQPDLYYGKDLDSVMNKFSHNLSKFSLTKIGVENPLDPITGKRKWAVIYERTKDVED